MDPHELAEERSLAIHRHVAERLRDDPGPQAPTALLVSVEADLFPRHHPERAELIDGSIGELSPFHQTSIAAAFARAH